jgi:galactose oxidase
MRRARMTVLMQVMAFVFALLALACNSDTPVERSESAGGPAELGPGGVGEWSPVWTWPQVPGGSNIGYGGHMHLLPTGDIMYWGDYDQFNPPERLWTPSNPDDPLDPGTFGLAADPGYNLFCSSHSFRRDGRLFVSSGHPPGSEGSYRAIMYDPYSDTWSRVRNMNDGRWYGTTITLSEGSVVAMSGSGDFGENLLTQVYKDGPLWRNLSTAVQSSSPWFLYPRIHLAPNNKVFLSGPHDYSRYLDTSGTGAWSDVATSMVPFRGGGTSVMYSPGNVLILGGTDLPSSAERIDLNVATPAWSFVPPMAVDRIWSNATILPDGQVLVTAGGVVETELYNPGTNDFTDMAPAAVPRAYHSTAALLPDGRVLSMGGDGLPTAELYKPPYFFNGPRPSIYSAPSILVYNRRFEIQTYDAYRTKMVTLVRLTSVTHGFNMNQRFNSLVFNDCADDTGTIGLVPAPGCLAARAPANGTLAPPGHYMLFIVDGDGLPSYGQIVQLVEPALAAGVEVDPAPTGTTSSSPARASPSRRSGTTRRPTTPPSPARPARSAGRRRGPIRSTTEPPTTA